MPNVLTNLKQSIKNKPLIGWAIAGFIVIMLFINLIAIFTRMNTPPTLVSAPSFSELFDLNQEIVLEFDRSPEKVSVIFHPALKNELSVVGKVLIIKPLQLLNEQTDYRLELKFQEQTFQTLTFKTRLMDETEILTRDSESTLEDAPLIKYLPLDTPQYYVTYIGPRELGIRIKQGSQAAIEQAIKIWMENQGVDPATHKLTFQVLEGGSKPQPTVSKTPLLELEQ